MRGVRREKLQANIPTVGIGYIFIPENINRDKYVKSCFRNEKVSVLLDQGGSVIFDCYIDKQKLQDITFPESSNDLGSMVVFLSMEFNNKPIVVAILSKNQESQLLAENSFKIFKTKNGNFVKVSGNGSGELFLSVKGSKSKINIETLGEDSEFNINSEGQIKVNSNNKVEINSTSEIHSNFINKRGVKDVRFTISENGLKYEDNSGNVFEVDKEKGIINNFKGSEPLTKGNTLKTQLDQNNAYLTQLQTAISAALTTLESLGLGSLSTFTSSMSGAQKGNYSNINSKKTFTD